MLKAFSFQELNGHGGANGNETSSWVDDVIVVRECSCENYGVWLSVHLCWKSILLLASLYIAWRTRYVSVPCLNDAGSSIAAIFTVVLVTLVAALVSQAFRGVHDAISIITTIAISACAILVQIILFFPKVE